MSLKHDSFKKFRKLKHKLKADSYEEYEKLENDLYKKMFLNREPTILGKVKITAGKVKNFTLDIPKNTRPLTSRLKIRVFDIIGPDIYKKRVLDLYSGTGSFGLEALSRGAKECVMVDAAKLAEKILTANVNKTGFLTEATIIRQKVEEYLPETVNKDEEFDIIFVDPPYKLYNTKDFKKIEFIFNCCSKLLPGNRNSKTKKFKGVLVIKHPKMYPIDRLKIENVFKMSTYDFGLNCVTMYLVGKR